jgi:2-iminoacetate synthase ThiH
MQQLYLRGHPSRINGDDWIKQFIYILIKISHTHWIFRNLTLHDRQIGHLAKLPRNTLAEELERLHSLSPEDVPEEIRFLLDFDIDDLAEGDISAQKHWILAMQAARKAGMQAQGCRVR